MAFVVIAVNIPVFKWLSSLVFLVMLKHLLRKLRVLYILL
jgi:hypothetical protein